MILDAIMAVFRVEQSLKGATVKQMSVGTHFLPMEYPDLVITEIQNYLLKNHGA